MLATKRMVYFRAVRWASGVGRSAGRLQPQPLQSGHHASIGRLRLAAMLGQVLACVLVRDAYEMLPSVAGCWARISSSQVATAASDKPSLNTSATEAAAGVTRCWAISAIAE